MHHSTDHSPANMWVNIEPQANGTHELVLNALGATERRIPFDTHAQAISKIADETLRYMADVDKQRQAET